MKHHITSGEAVTLLAIIARIKSAVEKSPTVAAAYGIDAHDVARINNLLERLSKK